MTSQNPDGKFWLLAFRIAISVSLAIRQLATCKFGKKRLVILYFIEDLQKHEATTGYSGLGSYHTHFIYFPNGTDQGVKSVRDLFLQQKIFNTLFLQKYKIFKQYLCTSFHVACIFR